MSEKLSTAWVEEDQDGNEARETEIVLLVGIVSLAGVASGLCGMSLWLLPDSPAWAVKLVVLSGALAVACLGFLKVRAEGRGILGILNSEPTEEEDTK